MRLGLRVLLAAALVLGDGLTGWALEPTTPLANYGRQSWGMENGLPQNTVQALVQTRNGFVWLGTELGLVRFDGNGFQVFDHNSTPSLPSGDIRCLLETRDGALWIGTSEGLARWKDGVVTAFSTKDGLPGNTIERILETGDGELWINTDQGLARFNHDRFAQDSGMPQGPVAAISLYDGALWVESSHGIFTRSRGSWITPFIAGLPPVGPKFFFGLPSGWVSANNSGVTVQQATETKVFGVGHELSGNRVQALFADREGSLWIGTDQGLARWAGGKLEQLPVSDPLAGASILSLMEDHEGNLWVGTESDGLDILRDQRFRTIGTRESLSSDDTTTVVEDKAGTLWVGTAGDGLNALRGGEARPGAVKSYSVRNGLASDVILSLASAANGDLWVGTPDGLNRMRGGVIDSFSSADGLPDDFIRSLLVDGDGSLWIGTRRGLTHWTGGPTGSGSATRMETYTQADGLGSDLVGAMARDSSGDLWVATFAGLSRLHGSRITNYTTANGLSSNVATALLPQSDGTLLIGTEKHGWDVWNGQEFFAVKENSRADIHAILDDGGGHLWFATGDGIVRCDSAGAAQGMQAPVCMHGLKFGVADGLRSRETATNSHPSAWRSSDGLLWFATPKGLVEVDPAHFRINTIPPPVELERFAVDDVPQTRRASDSPLQIPAGHVHFQFDYAGLSFTAPQKVRYRFKLEGFDRDWTEAGARRSAYYTAIPPGTYTFRVQAANNDGLWNTEGASLTFVLRPHFYQTAWFYGLLLAIVAGLVALLLWLLRRRAEREFGAVLGERNRIAREIHDTLAQGYVGISVQLEVLSELLRMSKTEAAAKHLDLTRGYVREGLSEARQSIWALRSQDMGETALPVRLRRMAEAANGGGLQASFSTFGAYRPLPPGTEHEILRVAQEAIHNVKKHAGARHLFVQLEYRPEQIALEVRDDGRGFSVGESLESPLGHYGLTGMRERAAAIGGTIEVSGEPGAGTTVRLRAAARRETREQEKKEQQ